MAERSKENATDLLMFGRDLRYVMGQLVGIQLVMFIIGVQLVCIRPTTSLCFLQLAGLRWFLCSILGLLSGHLGDPALLSEESVSGVRRAVGKSCSTGKPPHSSVPPPALLSWANKCWFGKRPQGSREDDDVVEKLNLFLDLLQSYRVSLSFKCCDGLQNPHFHAATVIPAFPRRTSASATRRAYSTSTREPCTSTAWWRGRWWVPRCSPKSRRRWSSWSLALFRWPYIPAKSLPNSPHCLSSTLARVLQPLTPESWSFHWSSAGLLMWLQFLMVIVVFLADDILEGCLSQQQ